MATSNPGSLTESDKAMTKVQPNEKATLMAGHKRQESQTSIESQNSYEEMPDPRQQARCRLIELSSKNREILHKIVDFENWANDINVEKLPQLQKSLTDLRRKERDEKDVEEPIMKPKKDE